MVQSRNLDWLHHVVNVMVGLFRRYSLSDNVAKSRKMTFQTVALRADMLEEAMALKCTGVGDSYRVRLQRCTPCLECGVDLTAGYMTAHRRHIHGTEPVINFNRLPVSQTVHQTQLYEVGFQ